MSVQAATPELLALAEAMRGEDWADDLAGPIVAAKNAGWEWPRIFAFVTRMLCDESACPHDLAVAIRHLADPAAEISDPAVKAAALAEMRSRLPGGAQ